MFKSSLLTFPQNYGNSGGFKTVFFICTVNHLKCIVNLTGKCVHISCLNFILFCKPNRLVFGGKFGGIDEEGFPLA